MKSQTANTSCSAPPGGGSPILYFLAELDVKEIHGYNPDLGLSVFTEAALARLAAARHAGAAANAGGAPKEAPAPAPAIVG